jgi:hypothetical protein
MGNNMFYCKSELTGIRLVFRRLKDIPHCSSGTHKQQAVTKLMLVVKETFSDYVHVLIHEGEENKIYSC